MNARAELLAAMPRGFADPVHDAQSVFRAVLDALSRPGQLQTLAACDGLQAPAPLSRGLTGLLLTLLDGETSLHLHGTLGSDAAWMATRFHTGVLAAEPGEAAFVAMRAEDASWNGLRLGSDDHPQEGATLIVEASSFSGVPLRLQGPGIESTQRLGGCGLPATFWQQRIDMQPQFPRGVDLVIVCGTQIVAVPRSTQITLETD